MNVGLLFLEENAESPENIPEHAPSHDGTQKAGVRHKVLRALARDAEVPAFPATVLRLSDVLRRSNVDLETIAEIARLDPGITARILKVASSPVFAREPIRKLEDALLVLGTDEIKRIATTCSVINIFRHLRIKVNWDIFWLHSLLTARFTEILVKCYREVDGREYLAGLLHDVGKLFLQHHFLREFDLVLSNAPDSPNGIYTTEDRLLGITHAEVSARLCQKWRLHPEVLGAVQFHHEPDSPLNHDPNNEAYTTLPALCVCVANRLANECCTVIHQKGETLDGTALEAIPEWKKLQDYHPIRELTVDVAGEVEKAMQIVDAVKTSAGGAVRRHRG
jgi:HD-like signal output (HDOD) protein